MDLSCSYFWIIDWDQSIKNIRFKKKVIKICYHRWEMFTNYKEDLTKIELKTLYATGVRCRGHHKAGNEEFFK